MPEQTLTIEQALNIAVRHHTSGELDKAEALYQQILQKLPDQPTALHNMGELLCRRRNNGAAVEYLARAATLEPNNPNYHNTLSVALLGAGRPDDAFIEVQKALALNPNQANAISNLGICHADRGELPASIAAFEKAIAMEPDNACAHDGLGLSLLMSGELQRGWQEQEWRWGKYDGPPRRFADARQWRGEDLSGKTIWLYVEQGFGDVIQFCRYVPLLAQRGAKVLLETSPELEGLLKTLPGNPTLLPLNQVPEQYDFACPLMSVPLWAGTTLETIPAPIPYLKSDPAIVDRWQRYFMSDPNLKVGICWAGRSTHTNDFHRSTSLSTFFPLATIPHVTFYSFQKGPQSVHPQMLPVNANIIDLSPRLENFDTTAAMVEQLDLVIAVDTVLVHLAGALGKPVWSILPFCPDWRWMRDRADTPWYPTMRLFRLPKRGDWTSAIEQVRTELSKLAADSWRRPKSVAQP